MPAQPHLQTSRKKESDIKRIKNFINCLREENYQSVERGA